MKLIFLVFALKCPFFWLKFIVRFSFCLWTSTVAWPCLLWGRDHCVPHLHGNIIYWCEVCLLFYMLPASKIYIETLYTLTALWCATYNSWATFSPDSNQVFMVSTMIRQIQLHCVSKCNILSTSTQILWFQGGQWVFPLPHMFWVAAKQSPPPALSGRKWSPSYFTTSQSD